MNPLKVTGITQFETDTFGLVCRIQGKDFLNYKQEWELTVTCRILKFSAHYGPFI